MNPEADRPVYEFAALTWFKGAAVQKAREHNMMQTAAVQKISEQNSPYKAMLDRAYMIGYKDANKPGEKPHKSRQGTPGKKKVFCHAEN